MKQRVAVVTGGLQGIGLAIARALTENGARVAVGSRRGGDPKSIGAAQQAVGSDGMVDTLDVSSPASVDGFITKVKNQIGTPEILVNAAGISVHQTVCGHSDKDWDDVIDINYHR